MLFTKFFDKIHFYLSWLVLIVGTSVMLGWIVKSEPLIQVNASFAPMVFNTALCLAALSLCILLSENRNTRLIRATSFVPLAISLTTLTEYFSGQNLGVDNFFVEPFYSIGVTASGRMAISTATCIFILALIVFFRVRRYEYKMALVAGSSIVMGTCLISLVSYALGFNSEYGWGSFSRMAIHTALSLLFLSLALLFQLHRDVRHARTGQGQFIPFQVVIIGILTSMFIWQMLVLRDQDRNRKLIQIRLESLKANLDNVFLPLEGALGHMAHHFSSGTYRRYEMWEEDAELYFKEFKGLKRLIWSDAKNISRWVYPLDNGGSQMVNINIANTNDLEERLRKMTSSNKSTLSKVFELKTGGRGFVLMVPVFSDGKYLGVVSAALLAEPFFSQVIRLEGYDLVLREDGVDVFTKGKADPVFAHDWTAVAKYSTLGVDWEISLVPRPEVIRENTSALPGVVLIFGVSISILLGLALSFYNRSRTSEKKAQEAFELKQAGMNSVPLLMIFLDKNALIQEMNATAEKILEYKSEEVAGKVSPAIFHDDNELRDAQEKVEKELGHAIVMGPEFIEAYLKLGYYKASEWTLISKSGKRYLMVLSVSKIVDENGQVTGYLKVLEDVTQLREKEQLLNEQEQKILASSRLASLGEMAAGIAHEINNPLAIINGHLGILRRLLVQKGFESDDDLNKRMDSVEQVVQRIARIIRGMRSYVRDSDVSDGELVSVDALIDDTLSFCHEKFRSEGIEMEVNIEPHLQVRVRPYQISQVLLNLLNNAHDALVSSKIKKIQVQARTHKEGIEISVSDTGPGVPYHLRGKIMEPFFTTKEVGKGVGLGLSISQGIVSAHLGKLYLDEASAKTRFVVWLPLPTDSKPIQL